MLFMQPVVVSDASAVDRSPAAEVRVVERRAVEQPRWNGTVLAQGPMDQRSPFGANAPDMNDSTPAPRMMNPVDSTRPGGAPANVADPGSTTKIPPPSNVPDAGPPPPSGGTATTPGTAPSSNAASPGGTLGASPNANRSSQAPSTADMPTRNPTGLEPGTSIPGTSTPGAAASYTGRMRTTGRWWIRRSPTWSGRSLN